MKNGWIIAIEQEASTKGWLQWREFYILGFKVYTTKIETFSYDDYGQDYEDRMRKADNETTID